MKLVVFEATDIDKAYLETKLTDEDVVFVKDPLTEAAQAAQFADQTEIISVFVHSKVTADIVNAFPNLRMIATRSTGFDHIDKEAVVKKGIAVSNVPTYGENTVAEHTFALILSISRNLHKAYVRTSSGDMSMHGLTGFDLQGRTLGVIGTGHIGLHVVRIGKGFGMKVLAFDPYPNYTIAELLGFDYVSLDELLGASDIVTLHAPLTDENKHLINKENLEKMKRNAILINTARGGLVDTAALVDALDQGIIKGAGLDVIEGEEIISEEQQLLGVNTMPEESLRMALRNLTLLRRPDMVITPHIAFDSVEAGERILKTTVENIHAFEAGKPKNLVLK